MEAKGNVNVIKNLGVFVILFCLIFDDWTGAGAYFDDFIYYVYQGGGLVSGFMRILMLCGGWYFLIEMIWGAKDGNNEQKAIADKNGTR